MNWYDYKHQLNNMGDHPTKESLDGIVISLVDHEHWQVREAALEKLRHNNQDGRYTDRINAFFGISKGRVVLPIEVGVGAINCCGYNSDFYRIGLTAYQIQALDLQKISDTVIDTNEARALMDKSDKGVMEIRDNKELTVEYGGRKIMTSPYNLLGKMRDILNIGDHQIVISSYLAEELSIREGVRIKLEK